MPWLAQLYLHVQYVLKERNVPPITCLGRARVCLSTLPAPSPSSQLQYALKERNVPPSLRRRIMDFFAAK